ncbi:MAG: transketolase [Anaerolineae bacterium]|nr:transketolase [Anaerolineae bacterium]
MTQPPTPASRIRQIILEQSKRANVGHIGSSLSIADIIAALYTRVFSDLPHDDPERDRFILSKGHAALAVYGALHLKGWISEAELNTDCADESLLGVHPEHRLPGIDFSTGSLGHGLSIGAGAALAARLQRSPRRVFVLLSDAEQNEGSVWEAAMFAAHHRLANLIAVLDANGQQAFGYTEAVLNLGDLSRRWATFGWDVHPVDGHDVDAIADTITGLDTSAGAPHLIIANTTFGKGVSFMRSQIKWHYLPMSDEQYQQALREIGAVE